MAFRAVDQHVEGECHLRMSYKLHRGSVTFVDGEYLCVFSMQVYFKPNTGYKDVFGVAWPMSEEARAKRTDAEIKEARAKAARTLTNIDDDERKRRIIFGVGLTVSHIVLPLC